MKIALIDNGSLEPSAHLNLRRVAAEISAQAGVPVAAVSWRHSQRIPASQLQGTTAAVLETWLRAHHAQGERDFVFIPFFISAQGAIGSALRTDLEKLRAELGPFNLAFTDGLAARGALASLVVDRLRATATQHELIGAPIIVVDHGGPSATSAELRDALTAEIHEQLLHPKIPPLTGFTVSEVTAASMEGADYPHNQPLLATQLRAPACAGKSVIVALLFLSPGRHAGAEGDLVQICRAAEAAVPGLRCHLTDLVGTHASVPSILAAALHATLSLFQAEQFA